MTEQGDRQPNSPEQGPLHYSVPIEGVLSAFRDMRILRRAAQYERSDEERENLEETVFEESLSGLQRLFDEGLPDNGKPELQEVMNFRRYQDRSSEGPLTEEPKLALLLDELERGLSEYYTDHMADTVVHYSAFLEAHPQLVRFKTSDGPFLRAIDAEFEKVKNEEGPARLIAYDENGKGNVIPPQTPLFINTAVLPGRYIQLIDRYHHDMGL